VKIELMGNGNFDNLVCMLAYIEFLGNVGHSTSFKVFIDGDGSTRWGFRFEDDEIQNSYLRIRREISKLYNENRKDIEKFNL